MKRMSRDSHCTVRTVGITDSFKRDHFEICFTAIKHFVPSCGRSSMFLAFSLITYGSLIICSKCPFGPKRPAGGELEGRMCHTAQSHLHPHWPFLTAQIICVLRLVRVQQDHLKATRIETRMRPFLCFQETGHLSVCWECFSAPSFSLRVMILWHLKAISTNHIMLIQSASATNTFHTLCSGNTLLCHFTRADVEIFNSCMIIPSELMVFTEISTFHKREKGNQTQRQCRLTC